MRKLKYFLRDTKGMSFIIRVKEFGWELRYAWQRAYRGYDDTDVFNLDINFLEKTYMLLVELKKTHNTLFVNPETKECLSSEETDNVFDEIIESFRVAVENETNYIEFDSRKKYLSDRKRALDLFSKYFNQLWD
jgi:hypothetical protein